RRRDLPRFPGPGPGPGRRHLAARGQRRGPAGRPLPGRRLRLTGPQHAGDGGQRHRGAGRVRAHGGHSHPRAGAGRPLAGAVPREQGLRHLPRRACGDTLMRWSVSPPTLGSSFDEDMENFEEPVDGIDVDVEVELPREIWSAIQPDGRPAETVAFVDGVQRIDGDFSLDDGQTVSQGRFLSMAAGMVYCDGAARIDTASIRLSRILLALSPMEDVKCEQGICYKCNWVPDVSDQTLMLKTHRLREELEVDVAKASPPAELIVIDGHLQHREAVENAIGYLKTQRQRYLPEEQHAMIRRLGPGERT